MAAPTAHPSRSVERTRKRDMGPSCRATTKPRPNPTAKASMGRGSHAADVSGGLRTVARVDPSRPAQGPGGRLEEAAAALARATAAGRGEPEVVIHDRRPAPTVPPGEDGARVAALERQ